ncbi:MAG: peptide-methionine (R)-S-oxide reductase MsrB [Gammaproteobacteria bacterium]|nr:peptide-methionine (R)-S-oxide reductase MsrB [Gammaproteobacteria bacterium]
MANTPNKEDPPTEKLTDLEFKVLRKQHTERAFSGEYWNTKDAGIYVCKGCGKPLFSSATKYDSGTGWPSFHAPIEKDAVGTQIDRSLFATRIEVHCAHCKGHLGHVFEDGPQPTGLRYCINSASLSLEEDKTSSAD